MRKLISAGVANFEAIRSGDRFYIDKTQFIADWWHDGAQATLIARPRRFGKSLMLSAIEHFFSPNCRNQETLFADLDVWQDEELRALAGTIPVISLSFSGIKGNTAEMALEALVGVVFSALEQFRYLESSERLSPQMRARFAAFSFSTRGAELTFAIQNLCQAIWLHHGVRPIVLLDEYDTPLQEAWLQGYWDALIPMMREFMNLTFKSNNYLERAILTGITRVSKESIFSDLNNLTVVTTTSPLYETSFGFTEAEVFQAMDDFGRRDREGVKFWYDGFTFGEQRDIYNPWSIASYLKYGTLRTYWANTSSNALVSSEVRRGNPRIKTDFEALLRGDCIEANIKEELSFRDLTGAANALWSLLLASGYLAIDSPVADNRYRLRLTNYEVLKSMQDLVAQWFEDS
ncbi:MAG: AAA family ATPase, partial [Duodenibacillus sp.]